MSDLADGLGLAVIIYRQKLRVHTIIRVTMNAMPTAIFCYALTVSRAVIRRQANRLVCAVI